MIAKALIRKIVVANKHPFPVKECIPRYEKIIKRSKYIGREPKYIFIQALYFQTPDILSRSKFQTSNRYELILIVRVSE